MRDAINFLIARPHAILRQTVAQTLTTGVFAAVTMDTEDKDSDGGHSTVSNTSRYTSQTQGYYLHAGLVGFANNATGRRACRWGVNGTAVNASDAIYPTSAAGLVGFPPVTKTIFLNVGDYSELFAFQDSGGNLNTAVATASDQPGSSIYWMST